MKDKKEIEAAQSKSASTTILTNINEQSVSFICDFIIGKEQQNTQLELFKD